MSFGFAATHCNTLQHTATHCNTLQHTEVNYNTLLHTDIDLIRVLRLCCNTLQSTATRNHQQPFSNPPRHIPESDNTLQHTEEHYNTLLHTSTLCCNTLQHMQRTTTLCYILQHSAAYCKTLQQTKHCPNASRCLFLCRRALSREWVRFGTTHPHTHTHIYTHTHHHTHIHTSYPLLFGFSGQESGRDAWMWGCKRYLFLFSFANNRYRNPSVYKMIQMRIKSNELSTSIWIIWMIQMQLNDLNCPNAYQVQCIIQMLLKKSNYLNAFEVFFSLNAYQMRYPNACELFEWFKCIWIIWIVQMRNKSNALDQVSKRVLLFLEKKVDECTHMGLVCKWDLSSWGSFAKK